MTKREPPVIQQPHQAARSNKTVVVPVEVVNGKITFFYGEDMPRLREGAIGDLTLESSDLLDKYVLKLLQADQSIDLVPAGKSILLTMRPQPIDETLIARTYQKDRLLRAQPDRYVEVVIEAPLSLRMNGAKRATLNPCPCTVPALDNRRAISLNQAYTLVSTVYQPKRQSHVGNVFVAALYHDDEENLWMPLDDLRQSYEERFEEYVTEHCDRKHRRKNILLPPSFQEWMDGRRVQQTLPF